MISVFVRLTSPRKVLKKEKALRGFIPNMTLFILDIVSQRRPTVAEVVEIVVAHQIHHQSQTQAQIKR
jgi:hypothetical protein